MISTHQCVIVLIFRSCWWRKLAPSLNRFSMQYQFGNLIRFDSLRRILNLTLQKTENLLNIFLILMKHACTFGESGCRYFEVWSRQTSLFKLFRCFSSFLFDGDGNVRFSLKTLNHSLRDTMISVLSYIVRSLSLSLSFSLTVSLSVHSANAQNFI